MYSHAAITLHDLVIYFIHCWRLKQKCFSIVFWAYEVHWKAVLKRVCCIILLRLLFLVEHLSNYVYLFKKETGCMQYWFGYAMIKQWLSVQWKTECWQQTTKSTNCCQLCLIQSFWLYMFAGHDKKKKKKRCKCTWSKYGSLCNLLPLQFTVQHKFVKNEMVDFS